MAAVSVGRLSIAASSGGRALVGHRAPTEPSPSVIRHPHREAKAQVVVGEKQSQGDFTMSMDTSNSTENREFATEHVRMYYEHQYDRMAKLEEQGLTITNIVITLSVVAFTFGFGSAQGVTAIAGIGLPFVMIVANVFAIAYIGRTNSWIRTHRLRAKRVLEIYAQDLYQLDKTTFAPHRTRTLGRRKIQLLLHILLIIAALMPLILYLRVIW
jgi:hypothetical protein